MLHAPPPPALRFVLIFIVSSPQFILGRQLGMLHVPPLPALRLVLIFIASSLSWDLVTQAPGHTRRTLRCSRADLDSSLDENGLSGTDTPEVGGSRWGSGRMALTDRIDRCTIVQPSGDSAPRLGGWRACPGTAALVGRLARGQESG